MKKYLVTIINLSLATVIFFGCRGFKEVGINNTSSSSNQIYIVDEIKIENPVKLNIRKGRKILELITTEKNAVELFESKTDLRRLMRRKDVYFYGVNPMVFNYPQYIKYPSLGKSYQVEYQELSSKISVSKFTTDCFLFTMMDFDRFSYSQTSIDSFLFRIRHKWVLVKVAFPIEC
jgi:hypothetical protein